MIQSENTPNAYCIYGDFNKTDSTALRFPDHYLAYSASGSMRLEIESRYIFLQPAKAAWIPAGVEVIAHIPTAITCCSILFDPKYFPNHNQIVSTIDLTPLARHMILYCRRWSTENSEFCENAQSFFSALALIVVERMETPTTDWLPRGRTKLVSRAVDLTMERHKRAVEIGEIASALATNERTLSRRIVDETGMKWSDLLRRIRIIFARELLTTTELQITRIAAEVGYGSQSAFNRAFKVETGFTPRGFQKNMIE